MSSGPIDYATLLATWEAQRAALDQMIASLRAAISAGVLGQVGDIPPSTTGMSGGVFQVANSTGEIPAGAFFGKSIPDAAKLYLEIVKKKQTTREIADGLQKGGMESNSRNFAQMVHSVLDRARKNTGIILKLDRSHWGLPAWYPAGIGRAPVVTPQKRKNGTKKPRKAKTPQGEKAIDRALEFIQAHRGTEHSLESIAAHVGMGVKGTRLTLGHLVKNGKIRLTAPGTYTAEPLRLSANHDVNP